MLIRAYRMRGHLEADLDPLGLIRRRAASRARSCDLRLHRGRLRPADPILGFVLGLEQSATLAQIVDRLRKTYCGKIGVEYMHISDPDQKAWIQERIERIENQHRVHRRGQARDPRALVEAEGFERSST